MANQNRRDKCFAVVMENRNPKVRAVQVWPEGESPTCATQEEARQRMVKMRDQIAKMATGEKFENWKVESIESLNVRTEHDTHGTPPIFSWAFAPRKVSAAA